MSLISGLMISKCQVVLHTPTHTHFHAFSLYLPLSTQHPDEYKAMAISPFLYILILYGDNHIYHHKKTLDVWSWNLSTEVSQQVSDSSEFILLRFPCLTPLPINHYVPGSRCRWIKVLLHPSHRRNLPLQLECVWIAECPPKVTDEGAEKEKLMGETQNFWLRNVRCNLFHFLPSQFSPPTAYISQWERWMEK